MRQHTTTPLAIGEIFNTVWDFQELIREQLIDYVRGAVTHIGGITPLKKILDYAAQYQIKSGMHGPTDISPVGMAAADAPGPGDPQLRHPGVHAARRRRPTRSSSSRITCEDGYLHPGDKPGLGVELNVDEAGKYPYEHAYLPYNRLADGTVHDW